MKKKDEKNGFYLNIVFLGDEGVGKSKYLNSFINNKLVNMEDSLIGINMEEKEYIINYKQKGILNLIDTAGQDKFKGITKNFYEKGDGFIIFSSFLIKESIKSIFDWIENIYQYKPKDMPILNVIVDGDKVEQETKDSIIDEMINYIISSGCPNPELFYYIECNYNIDDINECFKNYIIEILDFQKFNKMKKKNKYKYLFFKE